MGDKTSLILVPLVAAVCQRLFGDNAVKVPMVSGRGLGHTGGTLDKLESVPGFRTNVELETGMGLLDRNGFVMMGQTDDMAPADRLLYALRDVTATVESLHLIVSSIMSKKLSENLDAIVFDVKTGQGAFMKTEDSSRALARALVDVANANGVAGVGILTRMEEPLGWSVGNQLEVEECADFLEGKSRENGLLRVTMTLAAWMVSLASRGNLSVESAEEECKLELDSERPFELFRKMFEAQGGQWKAFEKIRRRLPEELDRIAWTSAHEGWIKELKAERIGILVNSLGGGRNTKEDKVDFQVGAVFNKKVGDKVLPGEKIMDIYCRNRDQQCFIDATLRDAIVIDPEPVTAPDWVVGIHNDRG